MSTSARLMTVTELIARLGADDEPFVIDVREADEHVEWRIPGSHNIPLGELRARPTDLPAGRDVVVYCASGGRSALAAALLREAGVDALDLDGGMRAWAGVYDTAVLRAGETTVVQVRRRAKGCLSYVVGAGDEALVVDPSLEVDRYLDIARQRGWRITRVFDTHLHADHLSGARLLAERTGAALLLHPHDDFAFPHAEVRDGERFTLGGRVDVVVAAAHTPGHTRGSITLDVGEGLVLTGDALFVDGVGRPDLAARAVEFSRQLHRSLHRRLLARGDATIVLPAHHGEDVVVRPGVPVAATVGELRRSVPQLALDEQAFVDWCVARTTPAPPNFVDIVTANTGRAGDPRALVHLESGPNRCSA